MNKLTKSTEQMQVCGKYMPDIDDYYYVKDHLGSTRVTVDDSGAVVEAYEYYPFGSMSRWTTGASGTDEKFTGKELDNDNDEKLYYFISRSYNSDLGIWHSVDPMQDKYPRVSPYVYCANNPLIMVDPDGLEPGGPGYYAAAVNTRTIGFILRHPIAAAKIGAFSHGSTNISTNSVRFSTSIGLRENKAHEGSEVNAFRHSLWQAAISNQFSESTAAQVGNAHENNPFVDLGARTFSGKNALSEADQTIDLLNNKIGRQIANDNPNMSMQELSIKVLSTFHDKGLFTATINEDGSVTISRTKISDEQYKKALETLKNLDNNGFSREEEQ